jgi:hypothetical protein
LDRFSDRWLAASIGRSYADYETLEIKMIYIQRKGGGYLETVDEFDTWKEARKMLTEYAFADPYAHYYLSRRACKDWKAARCV